ncbi:hypothetical protein dqs_3682 [Azoarcus olearius]|uniref:hypothetical protein n=1 Tax=Azoarcus sp. (strain BH72) TaxID=418699 RepID=UPI0008061CBA|nr:hypothetical protein [Azoarcus olearius]ANQ86699.1 hypothetical protein dqs_3682 [Azoarcus olearius]
MSAFERRFARRPAASNAALVALSRDSATELECRAGTRIVAVGGGVTVAYRDADGVWLDGGWPLRRVVLAEGDSHVLSGAATVALWAMDRAGQCLVEVPRPWWVRVGDWVMGMPAVSVGGGRPVDGVSASRPVEPARAAYLVKGRLAVRYVQAGFASGDRVGTRGREARG